MTISTFHPSFSPSCRAALTGILGLALTLFVRADSLKMPNGEILEGAVVEETADYVFFRSISFGELKISRAPGMTLARTGSAPSPTASSIPAVANATAPASTPPAITRVANHPEVGAPGRPGAEHPSALKTFLGLSDRWNVELENNLDVQNDKFHIASRGTELTVGYRVPNESKPAQPLHEYGLFAAHNAEKVDSVSTAENTEVAVRYFYQPLARWLLVSQADWMVDRINGIESRCNFLAIPAYRFIDTPRSRLIAGIGPSYFADTSLISTDSGTTVQESDNGFRFGFYELFNQTITPSLKFRQTLIVLARANDPSSAYNLRFDARLSRQLTTHLSLNLSYNYVRDEKTTFSLESTAKLRLSLGYSF